VIVGLSDRTEIPPFKRDEIGTLPGRKYPGPFSSGAKYFLPEGVIQ